MLGKRNTAASRAGTVQVAENVRINPASLRAYRAVCGYLPGIDVPICFPHLPAGALQLRILAAPGFPCDAAGLVHVSNSISQRRPISVAATYTVECRLTGDEHTERGREFALKTEYRKGSTVAWEETMYFLKPDRNRKKKNSISYQDEWLHSDGVNQLEIPVSGNTGRRYARVSGDYNPIHLYDFSARLFGFPGKIAHGMWMLGRCIAEMQPAAGFKNATIEAQFKTPLFIPGSALLRYASKTGNTDFELHNPSLNRPNMLGRLTVF